MGDPPGPEGAVSLGELSARLRLLQSWSGVSYREIHRRVLRSRRARGIPELPAYNTVYRCLQPGRSQLDVELVVDIARSLLGGDSEAAAWRQAYHAIATRADDAAIVTVSDRLLAEQGRFIGRRDELRRLLEAMTGAAGGPGPVVVVIDGMAGVGKTRLALHAAHRWVTRHTVDVQLTVNLRGCEPDRLPADPGAVLEGFLRQLGVPGSQLQHLDPGRRTALFSELLAGRRAAILLDNASSTDQIRPLLPPGNCVALITSRRRLTGLGATHITLAAFSVEEALDLLRHRVGTDRVDAESEAASRIIDQVGRLPLAVHLLANRIEADPSWTLRDHVERLTERCAGLRLDDGLEIALTLSYQRLAPDHQRLLRLLAIHPGRECDEFAAAALAGLDRATTRRLLGELQSASLLQRHGVDRYELHDLVRIFAAARAADEDAGRTRKAALGRLCDHYLHTAASAMDTYMPQEHDRRPAIAGAATPAREFPDRQAATSWLDAERANLLATAICAPTNGRPLYAGQLSAILFRYLDVAGHFREAEALHTLASRGPDGLNSGNALINLGILCVTVGRHAEALDHLHRAQSVLREAGCRAGEGRALAVLGGLCWRTSRYREAITYLEQAAAIFVELGDRVGTAHTLSGAGVALLLLGRHAEASAMLERALDTARDCGDSVAEGHLLINLAQVDERSGRYPEALEHLRQSLAVIRDNGSRVGEADALSVLGRVYARMGRHRHALARFLRALAIAREYGVREIEVQTLDGLGRALCDQGRPRQALEQHRRALTVAEELRNRYEQARANDGLARASWALGDLDAARRLWSTSLVVHRALSTPEAATVAACLRQLDDGSIREAVVEK